MAMADVDMDSDDGPVAMARGPGVNQDVTRLANAPLPPDHAAAAFSDTQSGTLGQEMGAGSDVREQLTQYGSRLEETNENQDRPGSVPANLTNVAGGDSGTILLDAAAGQATLELSEIVAYSNKANLAHELDNFLGDLPGNPPLGFDSYLVPLFNAIPPSEPFARPTVPLLNNASFPTTGRTQWMPDFTFGPPSERIDIQAFLKNVEEAIGSVPPGGINGDVGKLRPEDVAGWAELQELGAGGKQALVDEYMTSDPAHLAFVRDLHNRATLSTLGHTTESIKLPPEMRDRKRRDGKVGMGQWGEANMPAVAGEMHQEGTSGNTRSGRAAAGWSSNPSRTQASDHTPSGEDTAMAEPDPVIGHSGVVAAPMLSPDAASGGGGKSRIGKARVESEERAVGK
ncbi:hypothetical protein FRC10_005210 [Ceratobasidium sp. 414]|nr:hypothetical protein FRC10_005210 [Ceratobasidium sp. 414]